MNSAAPRRRGFVLLHHVVLFLVALPILAAATEPQTYDPAQPSSTDPHDPWECGTMPPGEALRVFRRAVDAGEVPDPATIPMPRIAPGPAIPTPTRGAPTVIASDIFIYEDSADLLVTDFSDGALFSLMADATRDLLAAECDRFDFVAFFLNFNAHHTIGAAFYLGLENHTTGLGQGIYNDRPAWGVPGDNVEGWVMMWNQASWTSGGFRRLVLGQEFEHRWGMFLSPLSGGRALQGDDLACGRSGHWNFRVDGQGSGMEIRNWVGAPTATLSGGVLSFNTDIGGVWSYPDLYLMGYVSPAEMDAGASELRYMNSSCSSPYNGVISTWGSAEVIAANGGRLPTSAQSQKDFRCGWIMIHRPGAPPTGGQLNNVVNYLNQWSADWEFGSLGRGTIDNTLFRDCNANGVTDSADVAAGTSDNCNGNCLLDECELSQGIAFDCNLNGQLDECDIDAAVSQDCQANGVPDECDIATGVSQDCTGNATPDECETDCNSNGIRDDCDLTSTTSLDCDINLVPDECDIAGINLVFDCNANGVPDPCDIAGPVSADCDLNSVPDECNTEVCFDVWGGFEPAPPFGAGVAIHGVDYNSDGSAWDNPSVSATIVNSGCPASTGKALKIVSQTPPTTDYVTSELFLSNGGAPHEGAPIQSLRFDGRSEAQLNPRIDWQLTIRDATNNQPIILIHWASTQSSYPGVPAAQRGKVLVQNPANPNTFLTLSPTFTLAANACYNMKVNFDSFSGVVQFYINDVLRLTTTRLAAAASRMDLLRVEQKANGQVSGGLNRLALDNVIVCHTGSTLTPGGLRDCNNNSLRDDCDINQGTSQDANANGTPDECEGIPAATVTGALSRKACDLPLGLPPSVTSESRQGGTTELRIAFNVPPGGPGPTPVTLQEKQCPPPGLYAPYAGASTVGAMVGGNELILTFTPGLENQRTYRVNLSASVTSLPGQFVEIRGLTGDVNGDGSVNALDRSVVVGAWTGAGFTCATDINSDLATNALDRSIVVGAWTGTANCAP